ncbi:hypothetical protein HDU78_011245 [Chytriomyces hyalinus]|nr:hypothetical protein HDU78_011245 [Chytriomyces hyalinus]
MEDSQAELLQMNEFQMTSDSGGQVRSRWAALSQNERDEYDATAHSQTMANKENLDLAGKSNAEIQEAQKKSYSIMLAAIRNFVKNGGTHIGASRLPHESDNNRRITTVALRDLAEQTVRQAAKADIQYQMPKVLAYLDTKQRMDPNDKIMACPKVVGGVQARQATFQGDLLCKYQAFKPDAKKVPLKELRQGKICDWPSAVGRFGNFDEKDLEILERNPVLLMASTDVVDVEDIGSDTSIDEETGQDTAPIEDSRNRAPEWQADFAEDEIEAVLDAANSARFRIPAYGRSEQTGLGFRGG